MTEKQEDDTKQKDETKKANETDKSAETAVNITPADEETETKDTTKEAAPGDTVIEEALMEKKEKRQIRPETKTALGALVMVSLSAMCLCFIVFSFDLNHRWKLFVLWTAGLFFGLIVVFAVARFASWDKDKKDFLYAPIFILWFVYLIPLLGIDWVSKYNNFIDLKKDQRIAEILEITVLEDGVEVLLPREYASDNSYLEKVLSLGWDTHKKQAWKNVAIPCQEGNKYWYKVKLPFPDWYKWKLVGNPSARLTQKEKKKYESNIDTDNIVLLFNHAWEDYETTKEVIFEDPNSL